MITDSFKEGETPIMGPEDFCSSKGDYGDVCIVFFSQDVLKKVLSEYETTIVATISESIARSHLYRINDTRILFYLSQIGAPSAAMMMDEARYICNAKKFIVFGSSGILDQKIAKGKIIVPTSAYRDEGFSYHFRPNSDYIEIKTSGITASFFEKEGIPTVNGKTWTTDAFYHETKEEMVRRVNEGCVAVDMECAALQALSEYRDFEFYTFFFGGDLLDAPIWNRENLGDEKEKKSQQDAFSYALKFAKSLVIEKI